MGSVLLDKRQEPTSVTRSVSTTANPSVQCRKISIGIMVDKTPRMGSHVSKEELPPLPFRQQFFHQEKSTFSAQASGKKVTLGDETSQVKSPWVSTRINGKPDTQTMHTFHDGVSVPQPQNEQQTSNCENITENAGTADMVKKGAMLVNCVPIPERTDHKITNASSEALKRKLWEVLGTAPSQNKKVLSSQTTAGDNTHAVKEKNEGCNDDKNGRLKFSDTIETDSEKHAQAISRPVTRSLTQKKQAPGCVASKYQSKITNTWRQPPSSKSKNKRKMAEKKVFSFDGQEAVGASSLYSAKAVPQAANNGTRNIFQVEPRRLSFSRKSDSSKSMKDAGKKGASSHPENFVTTNSTTIDQRNSVEFFPTGNALPKIMSPKKNSPDENGQTPSPQVPAMETVSATTALPKTSLFGEILGHSKVNIVKQRLIGQIPQEIMQKKQTEPHETPSKALLRGFAGAKDQVDPLSVNTDDLNQRKCDEDLDVAEKNENSCSQLKSGDAQEMRTPDSTIPLVKLKRIFSEDIMSKRTCNWSTLQKSTSNLQGSSEEPSSLKSASPLEDCNVDSFTNTGTPSQSPSDTAQCRLDNETSKESIHSLGLNEPCEAAHALKKTVLLSWSSEPSSENVEISGSGNKGSKRKEHLPYIFFGKNAPVSSRCNKSSKSVEGGEEFNLSSFSFFGKSNGDETDESPETMEQLPEDGLLRAISQLAAMFGQIKSKIKAHANKRNSEILSSVEDKIKLQLHDIDSQIQADLRNFSSFANSKRKQLESSFLAQQEKLKAINKKFKEDVNEHLQECRATLEELEAFRMESKGAVEKHRLLHRKLIMQMEEGMELQLSDAERSMIDIQKVARKRLNGLKHLLQELLDTGTLGC